MTVNEHQENNSFCSFIFDKAQPETDLNEIDVELDWIQGVREQVEFLNANMKHYCILFKVQRREFVIGGTA
jgi:hypothetical protein